MSSDDTISSDREILIKPQQTPPTNKPNKKESEPHFTQDLVRYVTLKNVKYIAILFVTIFIFYHGYLNSFYG